MFFSVHAWSGMRVFVRFVIFSNFHKISNSHVFVLLPRSRISPEPLARGVCVSFAEDSIPSWAVLFCAVLGMLLFSQRAAGGNAKCFVLQKQVNLQLWARVEVFQPQEPSLHDCLCAPCIVSLPHWFMVSFFSVSKSEVNLFYFCWQSIHI